VSLGSARPAPIADVVGGKAFAPNGTVIDSKRYLSFNDSRNALNKSYLTIL
jgi:hypothetical protein